MAFLFVIALICLYLLIRGRKNIAFALVIVNLILAFFFLIQHAVPRL